MRSVLALGTLLVLLAIPPSAACGGSGEGEGAQYCHDYTIHVGDESTGVHANEKGQFLIAAGDGTFLGGQYVEQDVAYLENDEGYFFSIWHYQEANGEPGLQRADEVCNNTPEGMDSDVIIC